jgi:hypothetical protein
MPLNPIASWFRRVVPPGFARGTLTLTGTTPLLMNSPDVDRDSSLYRSYWHLGQKVGKSLDDEARLRELEWEMRLYLDPELGPFIPGRMVKALLVAAAGKFKKGATLERSFTTIDFRIPLLYDGPRDQAGLWDAGYRYSTLVKNNGIHAGRVVRCRPMFPEWSVKAPFAFDPEEVDPDTLALIVERSQRYGIGDYRPEFGAFVAELDLETTTRRRGRAGLATKERNGHQERVHEAMKARVLA